MTYSLEHREWWVERWLELLDSYRFKKRLERARRYANEGNVLAIEFQGARVIATVKGSEVEPYQVTLSLTPFSKEDWHYVIEALSKKAIYSAQLLAGEMPDDIEQVFTAGGLSLFPFTLSEIHSRCTCLDKANPCKHIGAVYYQLADRFSEEPFVLFQLRGRTKTQILEALRLLRTHGSKGARLSRAKAQRDSALRTAKGNRKATNTPILLEKFWSFAESLEKSLVKIEPPPEHQSIVDRLGPPPLPSVEAAIVHRFLTETYAQVSTQAVIAAQRRD